MRFPRPQLNYANVIATIALFVALGGAAIAAGLPKNSVGSKQLKRGAVTAAKLKRGAVTSGKLAPKAVTAGKLGANAVLPGNLGNGIIGTEKIGDGAVIASKIKNGAVTTNKLTNATVTTPKLADDSVNSAKLADGSVSLSKLGKSVIGTIQTRGLESGQTLRGVFDIGSTAAAADQTTRGAVSFQFPLVNAPTVTVLSKADETTAGCSGLGGGSNQTPQAAPGNLCIYVTESTNLDIPALAVENNTRLGFGVLAKAKAEGLYYAYGQWAVTAP
jgi:trimeric autotransporter adhesin